VKWYFLVYGGMILRMNSLFTIDRLILRKSNVYVIDKKRDYERGENQMENKNQRGMGAYL